MPFWSFHQKTFILSRPNLLITLNYPSEVPVVDGKGNPPVFFWVNPFPSLKLFHALLSLFLEVQSFHCYCNDPYAICTAGYIGIAQTDLKQKNFISSLWQDIAHVAGIRIPTEEYGGNDRRPTNNSRTIFFLLDTLHIIFGWTPDYARPLFYRYNSQDGHFHGCDPVT